MIFLPHIHPHLHHHHHPSPFPITCSIISLSSREKVTRMELPTPTQACTFSSLTLTSKCVIKLKMSDMGHVIYYLSSSNEWSLLAQYTKQPTWSLLASKPLGVLCEAYVQELCAPCDLAVHKTECKLTAYFSHPIGLNFQFKFRPFKTLLFWYCQSTGC